MNPFEQQAPIPGVKNIVVVGSGKGGVGKSTVAVNLAYALKEKGKTVGLLDADIYGPSIPRMMGALQQKPEIGSHGKMQPLSRHGIQLMSIGFLIDENQAVVWRGPMLFKAMDQFFRDVDWGELDYLVIDLPPGTGDIALTTAQKVPVNGGITVCTPQNIALVDAKKAMDMFEKINIRHLGVVENMAYFKPAGSEEAVQLFPKGDLDLFLDSQRIEKLASIPFEPRIGVSGEAGIPAVMSNSKGEEGKAFLALAEKVIEKLEG